MTQAEIAISCHWPTFKTGESLTRILVNVEDEQLFVLARAADWLDSKIVAEIRMRGSETRSVAALMSRWQNTIDSLTDIRATTIDGLRAKAAIAFCMLEMDDDGEPADNVRLAASVFRDLIRQEA